LRPVLRASAKLLCYNSYLVRPYSNDVEQRSYAKKLPQVSRNERKLRMRNLL
jgi:hypothetical protein